ncbi:MAG: hypothetical protein ABGX00_16300 [Allomuricauda sp.]
MRKVRFFLSIILFTSFIVACYNEETDPISLNTLTQPSFTKELVDGYLINDIISSISLESKESSVAWIDQKSNNSKYYIKKDKVAKVTDSVGNITYAFEMVGVDDSPNILLNFIAFERVDGRTVTPFIMKYEFREGTKFTYATKINRKFKGKVSVFSLNDFGINYSLSSSGDTTTPCYDDIGPTPEDPTSIEDSSSSTTSSSSSGGGGASSGGGYAGGTTEGSTAWAPFPEQNTGGYVEVGEGSFGEYGTNGELKRYNLVSKSSDCPENLKTFIPINAQIELLCGTYNFVQIGDSFQANIGGLGVRFAEIHSDGTIINRNIFIKNTCIGVPSSWTRASYINVFFPEIYNQAVAELQGLMFLTDTYWSDTKITNTLITLISNNINSHFMDAYELGTGVGYATPTSCIGAPYNEAKWCP